MPATASAIDFSKLAKCPRLLMECELQPLQGDRFQPTGFADLGPARYTRPDGTEMLLVESAQSVANRLEMTIWDEANDDLIGALKGLPYIVVKQDHKNLTNSILEAHRINSPYILEGEDKSVLDLLKKDAVGLEMGPVSLRALASIVFKYDPNSVLHGVFLAKKELASGRLRMTRLISGFIEAQGASPAESGGVKNDRVNPKGDTGTGFGHVPFHRTEFVAPTTKAFFNLDLALLRGYALGEDATNLLIALALFKVQQFLSTGLRLRTACDLEPKSDGLRATRPDGFTIPSGDELLRACTALIAKCGQSGGFADPAITEVVWKAPKSKKGKDFESAGGDEGGE